MRWWFWESLSIGWLHYWVSLAQREVHTGAVLSLQVSRWCDACDLLLFRVWKYSPYRSVKGHNLRIWCISSADGSTPVIMKDLSHIYSPAVHHPLLA